MKLCLLVRPEPFPDESFKGYIIRLSEANGYPFPNRIYKMAGLYKYNKGMNVCMVDEKVDVSRLSQLTTWSEEQLLSLSFYNEIAKLEQDKNSRLVHKLWRFGTCVYKQQLCPLCLIETAYHRKLWDLNIVTTCPVHLCFLIDQCPQCQKKISPHRSHLLYCNCSYDFREAQVENVSKEQTYVTQLLNRKVFDCTTSDIPIQNGPLEHMEFRHIVYVIMVFCDVISLYFRGNKRLQFAQLFKQTGLHHLVQHSVRIFEHWPDSFDSFVDELRELPKGMREGGPMGKEFGYFHQKLQERLYDPTFMFVIQRLNEYLDQHVLVNPKAIERLRKRLNQKTAIQVNTQC
ncbi:TniQ family protein [Paenibacillus sp. FJAT-26967]|uniref:TniQ family protein n=1 Tax=Paenibacillus sp. FJAT-26967 TaxID=1729690 RepID=UPI000838F86B|nr:TniQ family protein [Paenibacillus sp. FJAT-26967]